MEEACDALLKAAYDSWTVDDNSIVDDITFLLIFLGEKVVEDGNEGREGDEDDFEEIVELRGSAEGDIFAGNHGEKR